LKNISNIRVHDIHISVLSKTKDLQVVIMIHPVVKCLRLYVLNSAPQLRHGLAAAQRAAGVAIGQSQLNQ